MLCPVYVFCCLFTYSLCCRPLLCITRLSKTLDKIYKDYVIGVVIRNLLTRYNSLNRACSLGSTVEYTNIHRLPNILPFLLASPETSKNEDYIDTKI